MITMRVSEREKRLMDMLRRKNNFNASEFFRKKLIEQYPDQYKTLVEDQTPRVIELQPNPPPAADPVADLP